MRVLCALPVPRATGAGPAIAFHVPWATTRTLDGSGEAQQSHEGTMTITYDGLSHQRAWHVFCRNSFASGCICVGWPVPVWLQCLESSFSCGKGQQHGSALDASAEVWKIGLTCLDGRSRQPSQPADAADPAEPVQLPAGPPTVLSVPLPHEWTCIDCKIIL